MSEGKFYVYVLARPDGRPFYIGKGTGNRIDRHEAEARRGHRCYKCNVIRKVWKNGKDIQKYKIFTTDDEIDAFAYEIESIALYRKGTLTNKTAGGDGSSGWRASATTRAKMSASAKAVYALPEARARRSAMSKAMLASPEARAKNSERVRAAWASPEARAKQSERVKAALASPEYRAKQSASQRARWTSPEAHIKQSASQRVAWARRKAAKEMQ